jgi:hypothetical protein
VYMLSLLLFLLFYVIVLPLSTLLHEFGHALGIVLCTKEQAVIYLGTTSDKNIETFKIGRFHFHIHWSHYGQCRFKRMPKELAPWQKIIISIGGPLISLLLAALFFTLAQLTNSFYNNFLYAVSIANAINFIFTATPMIYPKWWWHYAGMPSDGYRIIRALKQ